MPGVALTVAEAAEALRKRRGWVLDELTGCWYWQVQAPNGFGPVYPFYEAAFGPVPAGMTVRHLCDGGRRGCIRPGHLDVAPPGTKVEKLVDPRLIGEYRTKFARKISDEREARKASRWQFARELGISKGTLEAWENNKSAPTVSQLRELEARFGWDGKHRKWKVTFVAQEVVIAGSSGEAMRQVWDRLEIDGRPLKAAVHSVKMVGR